jgi:hypothetical protein
VNPQLGTDGGEAPLVFAGVQWNEKRLCVRCQERTAHVMVRSWMPEVHHEVNDEGRSIVRSRTATSTCVVCDLTMDCTDEWHTCPN